MLFQTQHAVDKTQEQDGGDKYENGTVAVAEWTAKEYEGRTRKENRWTKLQRTLALILFG